VTAVAFDLAVACLLPHPPIIVPAVGGAEIARCRSTHDACVAMARDLVARRPDRLVLVSPHTPRPARAAAVYTTPRLTGDLSWFRVPEVTVNLPADPEVTSRLLTGPHPLVRLDTPLDHGAVVPLWFITDAGWDGPTTVAGLPRDESAAAIRGLGASLAEALRSLPGRTAIVASGDMSHRVTQSAPAGYHPAAAGFDLQCRDLLAGGDFSGLERMDAGLRDSAAEDVVDPVLAVAVALDFAARGARVLSYEHPFGVGYMVAVLHDGGTIGGVP
jgi:aromatic ring-opening dioxygenase LigB subunit